MKVSNQMVKEAMEGLSAIYVSDRLLAKEMRWGHLRGGKVTREDNKMLKGTEVYALGFDLLGNMTYIAKDGYIRQAVEG